MVERGHFMTPGRIVLSIDNTELMDYLHCPKFWYYRRLRNLVKNGNGAAKILSPSAQGMERGTLVHAILDAYYRNIHKLGESKSYSHAMDLFESFADKSKLDKEDKALVRERMFQYFTFYGQGINDFKPMLIGGNPQVEIGFSFPIVDTPSHLFLIEGRIDIITNNNIFTDHKSQKQFKTYGHHNTQFKIYSLATGIRQVCVNCIGLQKEFDKNKTFHRQMFSYNHLELKNFEVWLKRKMFEIAHAKQTMWFEQNMGMCNGAYKTGEDCAYLEPCHALTDAQRDSFERFQYVQIEKWTPWKLEEGGTNGNV